jgi:alpha-L-fucosidase 2
MRVYEAMLERDGQALSLPVSVSPEYRGAAMNAWGRDASFQLACVHWLAEKLQTAAATLGEPPRPIWGEIAAKLPKACVENDEIMLWRGTPLEQSHRHHSHLAGLLPFDVIGIGEPFVAKSIQRWIGNGMGRWSGWCMSWAAQLHTALGNAEMAQMIIETWRRVFTNEGHGTLHDCQFQGFTLIGAGGDKKREIMQMDAGMGITSAILDCFVQSRRGVVHLFAGIPRSWGDVSFESIHTEDGFIISADRMDARVRRILIKNPRGGQILIADPWHAGKRRSIQLAPGELRTLTSETAGT